MIEGIGQYLTGAGVFNQGRFRLSKYIPKYISLGTMGLVNQDEDEDGLPTGISGQDHTGNIGVDFQSYLNESPGYGSDGYSKEYNNGRPYFGLGPAFTSFDPTKSYLKDEITYYNGIAYQATEDMIVDPEVGVYNFWNSDKWSVVDEDHQPNCWELITPECPRTEISFRDVVPEYEAEIPQTIDVIFSAMVSTNTFAQFRDSDKDYIFISEAGLWSDKEFVPDGFGENHLIAGYRLTPSDISSQYMDPVTVPDSVAIAYLIDHGVSDPTSEQIAEAKNTVAEENQQLLKEEILRVERNQVVQVVWKMQLGNLRNALGMSGEGLANGLVKVNGFVYLAVDGTPFGTGAEINGRDFTILGTYATVSDLESAVPDPPVGAAYGVGSQPPYNIYIWDGSDWVNYGPLGEGGTVDDQMSNSSTNAVQNKVIKDYIDELVGDAHTAIDMLDMIIGVPEIEAAIDSIDNTIGE